MTQILYVQIHHNKIIYCPIFAGLLRVIIYNVLFRHRCEIILLLLYCYIIVTIPVLLYYCAIEFYNFNLYSGKNIL